MTAFTVTLLVLAFIAVAVWLYRQFQTGRPDVRELLRQIDDRRQVTLDEITARRQRAEEQLRRLSRWQR